MSPLVSLKKQFTPAFTLLEVLIALVILAVSLTAASYAIGHSARAAAYIDQKTAAHLVAMNIISHKQVEALQPNFIVAAQSDGTTKMLNHLWYWQTTVQSLTDDQATYHINVAVSATQNGSPIEQLDGYFYVPPV